MFTVNRNCPSWVISIQHGAVWSSANGLDPIDVNDPLYATLKADTVPVPAPTLCALETNSCWGFVGRNSLPNGPSPCAGEGDPGAAVRSPFLPTAKLSINDGADAGTDEAGTGRVEQHVAGPGTVGKGHGRVGQRLELSEEVQREPGVVRAYCAGIGDVDKVVMHRDAHWRGTVGGNNSVGDQLQSAVKPDSQNRHLVTARIHREQEAAVAADLDRTLGSQPGTRTRAACGETVSPPAV